MIQIQELPFRMKLNRIRILFEGIEESFDPQFIARPAQFLFV